MKKEITIQVFKSFLDKLFPMGYGCGLTHATTDLDKWYIGYMCGDITIPLTVYCDGNDHICVQVLRAKSSEFEPLVLYGYVIGWIVNLFDEIYLDDMESDDQYDGWLRFAMQGEED